MSAYLKAFELTLNCLGPVFVGSGEQRAPKEYVQGQTMIYLPEMQRLYADIAAQGKAKSFEAFVMNTTTGGGAQAASRLGDWLGRNGIKPSPVKHGGYGVKIGTFVPGRERPGRGGQLVRATASAERDPCVHQRRLREAVCAGVEHQRTAPQHLPAVAAAPDAQAAAGQGVG